MTAEPASRASHWLWNVVRCVGSPVRKILCRYGYDIRPVAQSSLAKTRAVLIAELGVGLVVDVGANEGQYGIVLRNEGFRGKILSFEPQASAFSVLSSRARQMPDWRCVRCALGANAGRLSINIAGNSYSSSLLPMLASHVEAAPESRIIETESVETMRLDAALEQYGWTAPRIMLKADVQGYEDRVLAGSTGILDRIVLLELEVSFVPLYEGQKLFPDIHEWALQNGFNLVALEEGFRNPKTYSLLQADALYARIGAAPHESEINKTCQSGYQS
jgi:FkbM family methyltransferase